MIFYASTFNGQMLSHQDWESKYNDLEGILSADDTATANPDIWYHIGYDSPFTPAERRRNEIWIPQGQVDETNTQIIRGFTGSPNSFLKRGLVGCPWCRTC